MAGVVNIQIQQGQGFSQPLEWLDSEDNPIDLTGYTARSQVREFADSDVVMLEFDVELGGKLGLITLVADADKTYDVTIPHKAEKCVWDLRVFPAEGGPITVARGKAEIIPGVTR